MNLCWFRHIWSKWSAVFETDHGHGPVEVQTRICLRCNVVEQRNIRDYMA